VPWTISRYLVKEVAQHTALGLLAATPVILIPNVFDQAEEFWIAGATLADQLEMARCIVPLVIGYSLPIAFLFGLMMAIGRLRGDREITAMRANGLGAGALVAPICVLGAVIALITAYLMIEAEPRLRRELVTLGLRLASRGGLIEEQKFQSFGDRMIFVRKRGEGRRLEGVMILDASRKDRRIQVFDNDGSFKTMYVNVGAPWALCITPGPHQYMYSSNSNYPNNLEDGEIYKMELDGKIVGKFGRAGKLLKEFGSLHEIDCRNENVLYVGEITNWRVQKLTLKPTAEQRAENTR